MYFIKERIENILKELYGYIYPDNEPITSFKMKKNSFKGGEKPELDLSDWEKFEYGERWGGKDEFYWFRTEVTVPLRFAGKKIVYRVKTGREGQWDALNPQFLIYVNGTLIQGLDVNHTEVILSEAAKAGELFNIALHAHPGMDGGLVDLNSSMLVLDEDTEKLYYDLKVPYDVVCLLAVDDKRRIDTLNLLNDAINILDFRKPHSESFYKSVKESQSFITREFYDNYCGNSDVTVTCTGHTHIDVAWLWTLAQTREKAARSFSTVINLMKEYPEYIFMSSQPQLYKFIKEDYPVIFKAIKEKVKEGRWEPEGAMWLEADCNISSGESLVRQVLFGTRFFKNEFNVENKILWLPDVFGYSAALPQILKKSGIDYFMTTKISWNEYNKIPYDTFMWKGLDGTEILTHFITTRDPGLDLSPHITTYNGILEPKQIAGAWDRYQQKGLSNEVLVSFGHGDGGGGPTKEMLENARRLEKGIPGCPKVKIGKALDFFKKLDKTVSGKTRLPKWVGELYLEYHRGTYTSMARNKRYNRKSEFLYQDAELLSVMSNSLASEPYPQTELNRGWETMLLNQFHDILPGSSIKQVYEDSQKQYIELLDNGSKLLNHGMDSIAARISLNSEAAVVFNQLGFTRSDIVKLPLPEGCENAEVYDMNGEKLNSQLAAAENDCGNGQHQKEIVFFAEAVPAKGYKAFKIVKTGGYDNNIKTVNNTAGMIAENSLLGNRFFEIRLDENSNISSIYDKINEREVLKAGEEANVFQAFEDKPYRFDAWDINIYYQEKMWTVNEVESIKIVENGPVRAALEIRRRFMDSALVQRVYIYNDIPRIDFDNVVDWKEKQVLLKVAFPVDVHTDKVTCDIQYGNVERPTHWNTSWDYARFEVCVHKWADLSEDEYGVSLMNDCKYGYDIKDGVMRLTLIKSAISPNEDADREIHRFTYSLYPHAGTWKTAGTVPMAYNLNCPLYSKLEKPHEGTLPAEFSMFRLDRENVILEVVKKAEDSDHIIVRAYECYNRRTNAVLSCFKGFSEVWECDLMENNLGKLDFDNDSFKFEIKPFEIKTYKIGLN